MHYQFSLRGLLLALFYGAGLSTLTIRTAGPGWDVQQKVAAYVSCMGLTLAIFFALRGRLRPAGYLLLAPVLFIFAVINATMFAHPAGYDGKAAWGPRTNVAVTTPSPPPPPPRNAPIMPTPSLGGTQ